MQNEQEQLNLLRKKIDAIDYQIHDLLNNRAKLALEVAKVKIANANAGELTEFHRPEREAEILRRISEHNTGPLSATAVAAIFKCIMQECLAIQEQQHGTE